jgi:hypothetical protein
MSIVLSPETAAKAAVIPDFDKRLALFVEHQHALEQWRARRASPEIRSIVQEGMARGASLKESGVSREEIYDRLMALSDVLPATSSPALDE